MNSSDIYLPSSPRRQLLDQIKRRGVTTVDELVEQVGLSKTAIRAHLLTLESDGLLERAKVEQRRPGRPALAFRISARGEGLYPTIESELLGTLLSLLLREGKTALIESFFEELWASRQLELHSELERNDGSGLSQRLAALQKVLERNHFMPRIEIVTTSAVGMPKSTRTCVRLSECHCPLPSAVRATAIPCRLETRFLASVVGVEPTSIQITPDHRGHCVFVFDVTELPQNDS